MGCLVAVVVRNLRQWIGGGQFHVLALVLRMLGIVSVFMFGGGHTQL